MKSTMFYVPLDKATVPDNGRVICKAWWVVHPEGVAFYATGYSRGDGFVSPQCNSDRRIVEHLIQELHPGCEAKQIPAVYMAHAQRAMRAIDSGAKAGE